MFCFLHVVFLAYCSMYQYFAPYCGIIMHCVAIPHFVYPFTSTFGLLPGFGYYESCCCVHSHWGCNFFFFFLSDTFGSQGKFDPLKKLLKFLSKAAAPFLHSYQKSLRFPCSTFSSKLVIVCLLIRVIPVGVKWYLIVVSVCISPVT